MQHHYDVMLDAVAHLQNCVVIAYLVILVVVDNIGSCKAGGHSQIM